MQPLASRHHSLEMTDVEDVAELLSNFQEQTGVFVTVGLMVVGAGKVRTIALMGTAFEGTQPGAEPVPLVSASATCLDIGAKSLGGALTQLVYMMDGALASREMALAGKHRA